MANFKPDVLKKILANEGGYVNDPDDNGGETWAGVARNINPNWSGWVIVDAIKKANPIATAAAAKGQYKQLNTYLYASQRLAELVADLYQRSYWDVNKLGSLSDQQLAANACDCGVNCGTFTGAKMLQQAYNNVTNPANIPPLTIDGKIGNLTIGAINALMGLNPIPLYNEYNILRKAYYDGIIARKPSQAKYRASWYSRIIPYKA
jgi:lysozyme family protein